MFTKRTLQPSAPNGCLRKISRTIRVLCGLLRPLFASKPMHPPSKEVQEAMRKREEIAWEARDIIQRTLF